MSASAKMIHIDISLVPPREVVPFIKGVKAAFDQLNAASMPLFTLNNVQAVDKPQNRPGELGERKVEDEI